MWGKRRESTPGTRASRVIRSIALTSALTLLLTGAIAATSNDAAFAKDYPSWNDVVKARKSEAATKAEIKRIRGLLDGLRVEVEKTEKDAMEKGEAAQEADQKYQEQALKTAELQKQATEAEERTPVSG